MKFCKTLTNHVVAVHATLLVFLPIFCNVPFFADRTETLNGSIPCVSNCALFGLQLALPRMPSVGGAKQLNDFPRTRGGVRGILT